MGGGGEAFFTPLRGGDAFLSALVKGYFLAYLAKDYILTIWSLNS